MGKNIGKKMSKTLSGKYGQKRLDHVKQSVTDRIKNSLKSVIQKTVEEIANRITKVSKNSQQNVSETVKNKNDKEIPKERYVSPEER